MSETVSILNLPSVALTSIHISPAFLLPPLARMLRGDHRVSVCWQDLDGQRFSTRSRSLTHLRVDSVTRILGP
jgi:hypothetical protein